MPDDASAMQDASSIEPRPSRLGQAWALVRELFRLRLDKSLTRVGLVAEAFSALYAVIAGRGVMHAVAPDLTGSVRRGAAAAIAAARPDIIDRNGETLATDVKTVSVFAEPGKAIDKDEAVELLTAVLPDLNARELRAKLNKRRGVAWVKREITPPPQAGGPPPRHPG